MMTLLDQVERGELSVSEASNKIRDCQNACNESFSTSSEKRHPAKWLKIKIIDPESDFKLSLPPLPLRLTNRIAAFLLKISMKYKVASDLDSLDYEDIRMVLDTLKDLPPVQLVSVMDDKGTQIEIFTK